MKVILFGNRGSRPLGASADSPFEKYGGDTTSVGVIASDGTLIALDAGSGFWKWPYTLETLMDQKGPHHLNLFLSHYHDDHTMGLAQSPFLFRPDNTIDMHGPAFAPGLKRVFQSKANRPANPDLMKHYAANLTFNTLRRNNVKGMKLSDNVEIKWMPVRHGIEESFAYRINDADGTSFAFVSDTNHSVIGKNNDRPVLDVALLNFVRGADAMLYDCHYSDAEILSNPGFYLGMGHSSGEHGVRVCDEAEVPVLVTHHHDPNKTDEELDRLSETFRAYGVANSVKVIAAQPSLVLDLKLSPLSLQRDTDRQDTPAKRAQKIAAFTL
jgi:ribonuclease BN (tRNA processing enzyme)